MRLSRTKVYKTTRIQKEDLSTIELLEHSGYVRKVGNGQYVYLHMAQRVINKINQIIREELEDVGGLEIGLNQLQSADIWRATGRFDTYGSEMFRFQDRNGKDVVISGTNEELVTLTAGAEIKSHKDLPFMWFQTNNKFRDEIRPRNGLIRCKEFIMMDAYSFDKDQESMEQRYGEVRNAYIRILNRLGLTHRIETADSGEIGGSMSEEFIVDTSDGEIEVGHIFQLGTKYTNGLGVQYAGADNKLHDVVMGCYGIGVSRLFQVIADVNRIGNRLSFDETTTAYDTVVIVVNAKNEDQYDLAERLYLDYKADGESVLFDDRKMKIGKKLHEVELVGIHRQVLVGRDAAEGFYDVRYSNESEWTRFNGDAMASTG